MQYKSQIVDFILYKNGEDGNTPYIHIKYSDDGGVNFTTNNGEDPGDYLGIYADFSSADSDDPAAYRWSKIKGEQGIQGLQGLQGPQGEQGIAGVDAAEIVFEYTLSDSATVAPCSQSDASGSTIESTDAQLGTPVIYLDGSWSVDVPERAEGQYVWQRIKYCYPDGTVVIGQPVCITGEKGDQGVQGESGLTTYFHIKYSAVESPTNSDEMSETPNVYIGTYVDFVEDDSDDPNKYTWYRLQGLDGANGIPGEDGENGLTSYLHIAYANSDDGSTDFSITDSADREYIGQYTDFTEADQTDASQYKWTKIKGEQGEQGVAGKDAAEIVFEYAISNSSTVAPYSQATSDPSGPVVDSTDTQLGTPVIYLEDSGWSTEVPERAEDEYIWQRIKKVYSDGSAEVGKPVCITGDRGIQGPAGETGTSVYFHVKYSAVENPTSADMTEAPSTYIGTYVDENALDSDDPADYTWSQFKGDPGEKGIQGDTGRGISGVTNYYLATSEATGVTTDTSGWTAEVQSVQVEKKYLWNYEVVSYTDNTETASEPQLIGAYGDAGADGRGIKQVTEYYAVSTQSSTTPTDWSEAVPAMSATNKYLWNYAVTLYSDGVSDESTKCVIGVYGDDGKTYYLHIAYANSADGSEDFDTSDSTDKEYIGQYTDDNEYDSADYTLYKWTRIKGDQGVPGENGTDAAEIVFEYAVGDSSTTPPGTLTTELTVPVNAQISDSSLATPSVYLDDDIWSAAIPEREAGQYLWQRIKHVYADGTLVIGEPMCVTGDKGEQGDKGDKGDSGIGIVSVAEYYALSSNPTASPTSWGTEIPTLTSTDKYLWNYEEITYTEGDPTKTEPCIVGVYGDKGDDGVAGVGISSVTNYYLATNESSGITIDDTRWSDVVQSVSSDAKYLWNYEVITYSEGTPTKTEPCIIGAYGDMGVGVACVIEYYATSNSNTEAPAASKFVTSISETQQLSATNKYLWNYEVIEYTDGSESDPTDPCVIGAYGDDGTAGISISSVTNYYLATNESSGITADDSGWTPTVQSVSSDAKYLWNYEEIAYTEGEPTRTDPCIIGVYGDKGDKGEDGTSVTILGSFDSVDELNAAHPSGELGDGYLILGELYVWNGSQWEDVGNIQGPQGEAQYVHIKYSDDGEKFTGNDGEELGSWIGTLVSSSETPSLVFSDYTWKKFTEDVDQQLRDIRQELTTTTSSISNLDGRIMSKCEERYITQDDLDKEGGITKRLTTVEQTAGGFDVRIQNNTGAISQLSTSVGTQDATLKKHFSFADDGLTISGSENSPFKVVIDNDMYSMLINSIAALWLDPDGNSNIPSLIISRSLRLLGYLIDMDADGTVNCTYVGSADAGTSTTEQEEE